MTTCAEEPPIAKVLRDLETAKYSRHFSDVPAISTERSVLVGALDSLRPYFDWLQSLRIPLYDCGPISNYYTLTKTLKEKESVDLSLFEAAELKSALSKWSSDLRIKLLDWQSPPNVALARTQYAQGVWGWLNNMLRNTVLTTAQLPLCVVEKVEPSDVVSAVLDIQYPLAFAKRAELDYNADTKTMVVEYLLPLVEIMPRVKEVLCRKRRQKRQGEYVRWGDWYEYVVKCRSEAEINKVYDSLMYQIALAVIHRLYRLYSSEVLESVVFNGWMEFVDQAAGNDRTACILSIQTCRGELTSKDLTRVDPKQCFRGLKGVDGSKLHQIMPVVPVVQIDRADKRFTASYDVSTVLDEGFNLAAMDWLDFENLVRELFEKEFAGESAEVRVTRASRDGGVDAVIFNPDPLRGGTVVIQAKRYTNTVGVADVRELYGTVINEGANKGILITTSDYGPDAYEFAKDKPLTLLNGGNLLHMLARHGHKARIDLKEAKLNLAEKKEPCVKPPR